MVHTAQPQKDKKDTLTHTEMCTVYRALVFFSAFLESTTAAQHALTAENSN